MATFCLLSSSPPSGNPRLVKEADALVEAGHRVHVRGAYRTDWARRTDRDLLARRRWTTFRYVGGDPAEHPLPYQWTRLRHALARRVAGVTTRLAVRRRAASRVLPELERAACETPADLYVAHGPDALVAAAAAARRHGARVGFDAEDFLPGLRERGAPPSPADRLVEEIERRLLPRCDYVTAASPGIADAYERTYGLPPPVPILNVFPLADRPAELRPGGEQPLRLVWFSQTIGARRGLEDIVRAMGRVPAGAIELHLCGSWQPGYRGRLLGLAESSGTAAERIHWHAPVAPDDVVGLCARHDVGLALEQPSSENRDLCLSNKIFAYLTAGNAVVASATQAQRTLLQSLDGAGVLYSPGDAETLARLLQAWAEDRRGVERARRRAWDLGAERWSWECEKGAFLALVDEVLRRPPRSRSAERPA